jgi:hypothetical protein
MHTNFESHHLIHAQGGAVFYTHPARWWMGPWGGEGGYPAVERMRVSNLAVELPLDTLIGPTFDGLDVITSAGEIAANQKAFALWALLLNHGYRLAATASSDACFDRPGGAVPGAARTYAWLGGRFSLPAVARAIAAGRTFVTTGPLLVATLDGRPPGAAFRADGRPRRLRLEAWAAGHDPAGLSGIEVWRNGVVFRRLPLEAQPRAHTVELPLAEQEDAWYCARVNGRDAERQRAISGAFYFERRPYQAPPSVRAQVRARVADAATGAPLDGQLVEMTCSGTLARPGRRHAFRGGQSQFAIPGTARLRAEVSGYEPLTLSPFLDYPALVETITRLDDTSLVDWKTFERVRELLADVPLTFALEKKRPPAGPPPRRRTE